MNVNTGEMAHIVGRVKSPRSPRGMDDLPVEQRNLAVNLVLLCPNDHLAIDDKIGRKEWSVGDLQQLKRRHEDRIRYLTGLGDDAETVVIRVMGNVRNAAVGLSADTVRDATRERQRYPRYRLGFPGESDVEVDLRQLPGEGSVEYWDTAKRVIADVVGAQLGEGIGRGHVAHLSVFAFARIPLLVMLGDQLDDKIPTDLYECHRDGLGWRWSGDEPPIAFRVDRVAGDPGAERVTLVCSISGTVSTDHLPKELTEGAAIYELRPVDTEPGTDLIRVPETLVAFSAAYRAFLASLEVDHPDAPALDVLGAIPLTAGVEIGRRRSRDVHPSLRIWDRADGGQFEFTVEVGS